MKKGSVSLPFFKEEEEGRRVAGWAVKPSFDVPPQ